jgi:hypothetical protein
MIPTRSQVEAYATDHLVDAAEYWVPNVSVRRNRGRLAWSLGSTGVV